MKRTLIILTILASACSGVRAGLIFSDDFNYTDGPVALPTGAAFNPTSPWLSNSGTGAGKEIDVTNQTLIVTGSRSEDMIGLLAGQPYITNGTPDHAVFPLYVLLHRYALRSRHLLRLLRGNKWFGAVRFPRPGLGQHDQLSGQRHRHEWERRAIQSGHRQRRL